MDKFANRPETERREILQEAANRRGISTSIVEKDFWVCWTLKRLFEDTELAPHLIFKGGTSLSKCYGLIERFSEDIDLTISRQAPYLSDGKNPGEDGISGKERERRIDALKQNAQAFVEKAILPKLKDRIGRALGKTDTWNIVLDDEDPDRQTILFHYPRLFNYGMGYGRGSYGVGNFGEGQIGYIKPSIRLEFGARGETEPSEARPIRSYVAETFPDIVTEDVGSIPALAAERTFWEKATILHSIYHGVKLRERMSRHYYDTYMMDKKKVAASALRDVALLDQVVHNKSLLFRDAKASYETAKIGSLRLVPSDALLSDLKRDYATMNEMFIGEAPAFDAIMSGLAELEKRINNP